MTVNELTETLKAKGYLMASYTFWKSNILFREVTYTEYTKDGKVAIETKRIKGEEETKVYFISKNFEEEFKEIGIEVGTVLK